ncbi:MAG: alpha/beta fold hydrolase [Actinomycetota bacterium]|nr:alpha/beta fold hydrolase [Actinomycetota bacterium]
MRRRWSIPIDDQVSIAEHAQDCRALLGELDVTQAHLVGHSYGACVALQLALDAPRAVSSLALFENGPMGTASRSGVDQPVAHCQQRCLGAVGHPELAQDGADVCLHRFL